MSEAQLKTFNQSYNEKLSLGKWFTQKLKKDKINPTRAKININILTPSKYLFKFLEFSISFFLPAPILITK